MSRSRPLKLILITGFLGAGKTTLLNLILKQTADLKIGIIENEFGEVGIDGSLVDKAMIKDGQLVEINNGSVFCSCRHGDFIEALKKLADYPLDLIVIEATGIADPSPLESDIRLANKWVGYRFQMAGNICIVDTVNFLDMVDTLEALERQIRYANIILLNKIDLVERNLKQSTIDRIKIINPDSDIIETRFCDVNLSEILDRIANKILPRPQNSTNTTLNKPMKILLDGKYSIRSQDLKEFFHSIKNHIFRIKGFLQASDEAGVAWIFVDGVKGDIKFHKVSAERRNAQLVVILPKGSSFHDIITEGWAYLTGSSSSMI